MGLRDRIFANALLLGHQDDSLFIVDLEGYEAECVATALESRGCWVVRAFHLGKLYVTPPLSHLRLQPISVRR